MLCDLRLQLMQKNTRTRNLVNRRIVRNRTLMALKLTKLYLSLKTGSNTFQILQSFVE